MNYFLSILELCSFTAEFAFLKMIVLCSYKIHEKMLKSVLHSKMKFFESTPIGRILNRFSNDIMTIDFKLNGFFKNFCYYLFELSSILIMLVISAPVFIFFLFPVFFLYLIIQVKFSLFFISFEIYSSWLYIQEIFHSNKQ